MLIMTDGLLAIQFSGRIEGMRDGTKPSEPNCQLYSYFGCARTLIVLVLLWSDWLVTLEDSHNPISFC